MTEIAGGSELGNLIAAVPEGEWRALDMFMEKLPAIIESHLAEARDFAVRIKEVQEKTGREWTREAEYALYLSEKMPQYERSREWVPNATAMEMTESIRKTMEISEIARARFEVECPMSTPLVMKMACALVDSDPV